MWTCASSKRCAGTAHVCIMRTSWCMQKGRRVHWIDDRVAKNVGSPVSASSPGVAHPVAHHHRPRHSLHPRGAVSLPGHLHSRVQTAPEALSHRWAVRASQRRPPSVYTCQDGRAWGSGGLRHRPICMRHAPPMRMRLSSAPAVAPAPPTQAL